MHRYIKSYPQIKTHLDQVYDYKRALCEDPELFGAWFRLVEIMKVKCGISDCDFYNFDETCFMVSVICAAMIVTRANRRGRDKAEQPNNRE